MSAIVRSTAAARARLFVGSMSLTLAFATTAAAQPSTTDRVLARADSITVGDYCRLARQTLSQAAVRTALAGDSTSASLGAERICDPLFARFSLRALHGSAPAPMAAIARLDREAKAPGTVQSARTLMEAMDEFRSLVRGPDVRGVVRQALGDSLDAALVRVSETAHLVLVVQARDAMLQRLARYERKLGPTSARLNGPEVLLNWAAQRWVPGFAPHPLRGPSPREIVASYVPTYATVSDDRPQAVSASEFGLRWYLFGESFGRTGWAGILRPSYWSAGALVVSDRNGALVWPWDGRSRTGAYVSWGATKVGYVPGRRGALLLSRQTQVLPLVF